MVQTVPSIHRHCHESLDTNALLSLHTIPISPFICKSHFAPLALSLSPSFTRHLLNGGSAISCIGFSSFTFFTVATPLLSARSAFNGQSLRLSHPQFTLIRQKISRFITMMAKPTIQFIQGTDEQTMPDVKLTKSRDGTNGVAIFTFDELSVFDSSGELGDITGFYMIDEGVLQSVDVSAKFVNGKPSELRQNM